VPLVLASVVLVAYAGIVQMRAAAILKGVYALSIGSSSITDIEQLAAGIWPNGSSKECGDTACEFGFYVDNSWLHKVRLEPFAVFQATVTVQNGIVNKIRVSLMRDTQVYPTHPSAGIVTEYAASTQQQYEKAYDFPQPIGKPYLDVKLRSDATPDQRRRAYAFSLTCLTKPGSGCDLPCDYLPLAWKDWTPLWENEPHLRRYYPGRARCE
jgi:hypothetical protein